MIPTHCRHRTYLMPGKPAPDRCDKGIAYADVRLDAPGPYLYREPCSDKGRSAGAACACFEPWTPEEIAAEEAWLNATFTAIDKGTCPDCGKALVSRGAWTVCPDGHVKAHVHQGKE